MPSSDFDARIGTGPGERRRAPRHHVALGLTFDVGAGTTRDMSAAGVFFTTGAAPADSAAISLAIETGSADGAPLLVQCHGRVVRVERCADRFGVAVAFEDLAFALPAE